MRDNLESILIIQHEIDRLKTTLYYLKGEDELFIKYDNPSYLIDVREKIQHVEALILVQKKYFNIKLQAINPYHI